MDTTDGGSSFHRPAEPVDDGGSAFPMAHKALDYTGCGTGDEPEELTILHPGMTLRDWFAGQALAGVIDTWGASAKLTEVSEAAELSYRYADALLLERRKCDEAT